MKYEITVKTTEELTIMDVNALIQLKRQYWPYNDKEQKMWLNRNIESNDMHMLINREGVLLAYLNAVKVDVNVNDSLHKMLGIGNVCVDRDSIHTGLGSILMTSINATIRTMNTSGILLCKEKLINFYETLNWNIVNADTSIQGQPCEHFVMVYDPLRLVDFRESPHINISRNF